MAVAIMLYGCNNHDKILEKIDNIKRDKLVIPLAEMAIFQHSYASDTISVKDGDIKLVFYVSEGQCQSCYFSQLVKFGNKNRERLKANGAVVICIFEVNKRNSLLIDDILCDAGIKGLVFKDTCGAFLKANKRVPPNNEMYHSFVLDKENNVP